jgi:iron-sulfur cluster assembly protein
MISVTEQAAQKIRQHLQQRGRGLGIRVGVRTTGCSGLAYTLEYLDNPGTVQPISYQSNGVTVFVDTKDAVYLEGMTLDYQKKGLNEGFEFINPNELDRCGCGESFRV